MVIKLLAAIYGEVYPYSSDFTEACFALKNSLLVRFTVSDIEQASSPVKQLLVPPKTEVPLLHRCGYLPGPVHCCASYTLQSGRTTDCSPASAAGIASSYTMKATSEGLNFNSIPPSPVSEVFGGMVQLVI